MGQVARVHGAWLLPGCGHGAETLNRVLALSIVCFSAVAHAAGGGVVAAAPAGGKADVGKLFEQYCFSCHDDTAEGDVRFDNLATLPLAARLDMMNRMLEQVYLKQMPPPKKKSQPTDEERKQLARWIWDGLNVHKASKLEDKLRYPAYGNFVDHEQLFGGKIVDLIGQATSGI